MPTDGQSRAVDPSALDARAIRRSFGRAARTYADAASLQREVSANLERRLGSVQWQPAAILDAGCGAGCALPALAARFPRARRVGLDLALPMLEAARQSGQRIPDTERKPGHSVEVSSVSAEYVCGDIAALPFAAETFDLVWSNLAIQWIGDLPRAFAEMRRVLRTGGLLSLTTFGPATLQELRAAFAGADRHTHVSRFVDAARIEALLRAAGFAEPVVKVEQSTLRYADGMAMIRDLRAIGATNATQGRPRGLTGRERWRQMLEALEAMRRDDRIPATFEVIYAQAWKREGADKAPEVLPPGSRRSPTQRAGDGVSR